MKSIVLLIIANVNGITYTGPATYYDTPQACMERVERIMAYKYPFQVRTLCATVVPEVKEKWI
jgi:hypothetical protein